MDKNPLRGIKRRNKQRRDPTSRKHSLGDTKKIFAHSEPASYRIERPRPKPKIGPFLERIAQIIDTDESLPKKQRHTSNRIYERIKKEGYQGGYTQVKEAVREIRRVKREVFMPLIQRPGEAQHQFHEPFSKSYPDHNTYLSR